MKWSRWPSASAFALLLAAAAPASAEPLRRASAEVAVGGLPAISAHIRRELPGRVRGELARLGIEGYPPGARLHLRITNVYRSSFGAGPGFGRFGGGGSFAPHDTIEGEGLVLDARGRVLERRRVIANSPAGGVGFAPGSEPRRVQALIETLAYWAPREFAR